MNFHAILLLVFSGTSSDTSLCLFTTVTGTPIRIASASISLVFLTSKSIVKVFLKIMGKNQIRV